MPLPFFTIGHSNRSIGEFVELLREAQVELVVDVRKIPMSRANPQFNETALPASLGGFQVGYVAIPALGGRRGRDKVLPPAINGLWENQSFHNYADYALSAEFRAGLAELVALGRERRSAIMCSEAVWWRCHRRIIADYLLAGGETVLHIMSAGRIEPARLTTGAVLEPHGTVHYPGEPPGAAMKPS